MKNFALLASGIDVAAILDQLAAAPQLWNLHPERRYKGSPHTEMEDIWVRFRPKHELVSEQSYKEFFSLEWYPARRLLPAVENIAHKLMAKVQGVQLGGILITKILPGGSIKPHHDRGRWHSEFFNTKVYIPLQSNSGCLNICEEDQVTMQVGEVWTFDNLKMHSVENNGNMDRITLIISIRTEP